MAQGLTLQQLQAMGAKPAQQGQTLQQLQGQQQPVQPTDNQSLSDKIWGGLSGFGNAMISSEKGFGNEIGAAIGAPSAQKQSDDLNAQHQASVQQMIQLMNKQKAAGQDTSKTMKIIQDLQSQAPHQVSDVLPSVNDTNLQVLGNAGGVATDILSAGQLEGAGKAALAPKSIGQGIIQGAKSGAKAGAVVGGAQGFFKGLGAGQDVGQAVGSGVGGAVAGGAGGAVIGGAIGGVSGGIQGATLRKQQLTDELTNNPELVAKYDLKNGQAVKNPQAAELVRQGVPEKQVAVIKNASPEDQAAMRKMLGLAENAQKNAKSIERPSDVIGDTMAQRVEHVVEQRNLAGDKIDAAAQQLVGQKIDVAPAVENFNSELDRIGVKIGPKGLDFAGSDVEGIKPAESLLNRVYSRIQNIGDDAYKAHQVKRFIDEQLTYGKNAEGIAGQTEAVLKSFRHNVDGILDSNFENYDIANTSYKAARDLLDTTHDVLGNNFNPNTGAIRAGAVARRILSNSASRGDIVEYMKNLENYYAATGGKGKADLISQTIFADSLEDIFGTQATTGLQGQLGRAIEHGVGIAKDLSEGKLIKVGAKAIGHGVEALQNITPEAKLAALKALIGAK